MTLFLPGKNASLGGVALLICATLAGCSGQVLHEPAGTPTAGTPEKGIVYYNRFMALQYYHYTKHVDDKGKEDGVPCNVKFAYQQAAPMVDYGHPMIIYFSPGFLESYHFSPMLNSDGTLGSGAVESTPDQGNTFKNVTSGIGNLAAVVPKAESTFRMDLCTLEHTAAECAELAKEASTPPTPKPHAASIPDCNGGPLLYTFSKLDMTQIPVTPIPAAPATQ